MRSDRLVIISLFIIGCKANVPTSTISYSEDLSIHRPSLVEPNVSEDDTSFIKPEVYVPLTGDIGSELDSISIISYQRKLSGITVDGYVFQVYSGSDRTEANEIVSELDELFPDLNAKLSYRQPNFRVKAGRFTDRLEANRIYKEVKKSFPRTLLIPERFTMVYE